MQSSVTRNWGKSSTKQIN